MEIMSPRGRGSQAVAFKLAERLPNLSGKTIGLLDNGKSNAGVLLTNIASILQEQYGAGEVVHLYKAAISKPAPAETINELAARADFVVTAIGD